MCDAAERCLAIGFFDGVHLGHQAILSGVDRVVTFRTHPLEYLAPERAPRLIMSLDERVAAIRSCGVGEVVLLDFDKTMAEMEPEEFLGLLRGQFLAGISFSVRCGDNWRFGQGGRGDAAYLRSRGIPVEVVGYAEYAGEKISSSRIRRSLAAGEIEAASAMLGRPCVVRGHVQRGKGRGREMGYPTLNVWPGRPLNLRLGVYAVDVVGCRGVANYGLAPTMGEAAWREPVLEVHVLEGETVESITDDIEVRLLSFIRDERTFDSPEDLKRQIAADCELAKRGVTR